MRAIAFTYSYYVTLNQTAEVFLGTLGMYDKQNHKELIIEPIIKNVLLKAQGNCYAGFVLVLFQ